MQDTGKALCPFCARELPENVGICLYCGRNLHAMKLAGNSAAPKADLYEIIPDAGKFGIAYQGEIRIHGLDFKKAQSLLSILNSVKEKIV